MTRTIGLAFLLVGVVGSVAAAEDVKRDDHVQLEFGVNTRHFAAADPSDIAFRSSEDPSTDPALDEGTAMTTSFRFTGRSRYNTFLGVEGETGYLVGHEHSNLAGAYGVAGLRHGLAQRLQVAAELVGGIRWVRYRLIGSHDDSVMIAEPRVRADLWLSPRVTFGAAAGATLGDRAVWMAGVYIGIHSADFDR
jgi:hypothetical protein